MITYSRDNLLNIKQDKDILDPVSTYKLNIFYHNNKLDYNILQEVVNVVNRYSEKDKTEFVSMYSYLGLESVYNDYKNLVLLGLDINIKNEWGFTILHYAYIMKDFDFVAYLLEKGADTNAEVSKGPHIGKKPIDFNQTV